MSRKYYAIVIKPVLTFSEVTSFDFERHELNDDDLDEQICKLLGEEDFRYPRVRSAEAIGSMLLEDPEKISFSVGFWIDGDAPDHGKIVAGKKTASHLNSFATIIRRAAIGMQQGVNPITIAPVAGRVVVMGVDGEEERNPYALSERRCDLAIAALSSLIGSHYIGDEEFDQMFLSAFISPTFEEDMHSGMVANGVSEETAARIIQRLHKISAIHKKKRGEDDPTGTGEKGLVN
jgi:hypothetical protein